MHICASRSIDALAHAVRVGAAVKPLWAFSAVRYQKGWRGGAIHRGRGNDRIYGAGPARSAPETPATQGFEQSGMTIRDFLGWCWEFPR